MAHDDVLLVVVKVLECFNSKVSYNLVVLQARGVLVLYPSDLATFGAHYTH